MMMMVVVVVVVVISVIMSLYNPSWNLKSSSLGLQYVSTMTPHLLYLIRIIKKKISHKLDILALAYNLSTKETEVRESIQVQVQPGLHDGFQTSLSYLARLDLKKANKQRIRKRKNNSKTIRSVALGYI